MSLLFESKTEVGKTLDKYAMKKVLELGKDSEKICLRIRNSFQNLEELLNTFNPKKQEIEQAANTLFEVLKISDVPSEYLSSLKYLKSSISDNTCTAMIRLFDEETFFAKTILQKSAKNYLKNLSKLHNAAGKKTTQLVLEKFKNFLEYPPQISDFISAVSELHKPTDLTREKNNLTSLTQHLKDYEIEEAINLLSEEMSFPNPLIPNKEILQENDRLVITLSEDEVLGSLIPLLGYLSGQEYRIGDYKAYFDANDLTAGEGSFFELLKENEKIKVIARQYELVINSMTNAELTYFFNLCYSPKNYVTLFNKGLRALKEKNIKNKKGECLVAIYPQKTEGKIPRLNLETVEYSFTHHDDTNVDHGLQCIKIRIPSQDYSKIIKKPEAKIEELTELEKLVNPPLKDYSIFAFLTKNSRDINSLKNNIKHTKNSNVALAILNYQNLDSFQNNFEKLTEEEKKTTVDVLHNLKEETWNKDVNEWLSTKHTKILEYVGRDRLEVKK